MAHHVKNVGLTMKARANLPVSVFENRMSNKKQRSFQPLF
jgi:hypothetical protein